MKYIIEFEDEYSMNEGGMKYHQCKQVPYWSVSHGIIKNLTPYTEPDRKAIEDEVWKLARTIESMSVGEIMNIFDVREENVPFLCNTRTYQEAKSKFEAWLKQKDEIHVGDEIEYGFIRGIAFVVDEVMVKGFYINDKERVGESFWWNKKDCKKTGRHFPEVEELLEKMREEE